MDRADKDTDTELKFEELFRRYNCAAEVVIPYRIPRQHHSALAAYIESRFKPSLWNMDFPWLLVIGTTLAVTAVISVLSWFIGSWYSSLMAGSLVALALMGLFPLVFVFLSPLAYPLSVYVNMRMAWGHKWFERLSGPTHIAITDSGFKLCVRGRLFYNYPNLAIWSEVFDVELVSDEQYDTVSLRFVYQTGFGRAALRLPLSGFASADEMTLVVDCFSRYVPEDRQGKHLMLMKQLEFAPMIDAFHKGRLNKLEYFENDALVNAVEFKEAMKQCAVKVLNSED